ncbi:hypothetical protein GUJ93_ZPchr0586g11348 [Zizania palustris]|uniref:Uncharacterized protein n=1 Tax=Zizania palustris TaxID=103762 RepID=A0A8J5QZC9_ZIZPA|nr:hypothetical protein GUJ93_ZPchr0586g11348 [Zizania palustris]
MGLQSLPCRRFPLHPSLSLEIATSSLGGGVGVGSGAVFHFSPCRWAAVGSVSTGGTTSTGVRLPGTGEATSQCTVPKQCGASRWVVAKGSKRLHGGRMNIYQSLSTKLYTRDSSKSWRQAGSDGSSQLTLKEPSTNMVLADHVATKKWQQVIDFDDHLDDISKDWLNPGLLA